MRLGNNLRWLVVMSVDGQEMPGEYTEENIKEFLCQERTEGVYDLCQLCGRDEGIRHREQLDDFNAYVQMSLEERQECGEELIRPLCYDRWDWRRGSVTHPTICGKKHLIAARMMGNQVVQNRLKDLLDLGERTIDNAMRGATRLNIPNIKRFMMDELRKKELEPFIGSLGSQDKKFGLVKIQQEANETIIGKSEWEAKINQGGLFNRKLVDKNRPSASLEKWREALVLLGFFLPESMNMKPIHNQCVLDTCWMGWIPKAWKTILIKCLKIVKEEKTTPLRIQQELREKIFDCYKKLRYAVSKRAELLQIVTREDISQTKRELRARFVDTASIPGEGRCNDESCDTDGIIDIDFRFDVESVESELSIDLEETLDEEIVEEHEISHENGVEEAREKALANERKINCTHGWCVIAKHIGAVHGKVHMEGQKCGMCTVFYKDPEIIKQWEKKLLRWMSSPELLGFIEKPSKKVNLVALEKFILEHITNDVQKKCFPRWLNNIANTLILKQKGRAQLRE